MPHFEITSRVDADGVLRLALPLGAGEANREMKVVIDPLGAATSAPPVEQAAWREFVASTAGSIPDPTFRRPDQGEYEPRYARQLLPPGDV